MARPVRFTAHLELAGKTATGFQVPGEVVERLGAGKRPPVKVTINRHTWSSTVAVMGGRYMLGGRLSVCPRVHASSDEWRRSDAAARRAV
jgi:hypothetical protein